MINFVILRFVRAIILNSNNFWSLLFRFTKIIGLIFNYFLVRSLKRRRYFIASEHCIILRNVVVRATNY